MNSLCTRLQNLLMGKSSKVYLLRILQCLFAMVFLNVIHHMVNAGVMRRKLKIRTYKGNQEYTEDVSNFTQRQLWADDVTLSFDEGKTPVQMKPEDGRVSTYLDKNEDGDDLPLQEYKNTSLTNAKDKKMNGGKSKTILVWSEFGRWGVKDHNFLFSRQIAGKCPHSCRIIYNKKRSSIADAIVFTSAKEDTYPSNHLRNQKWILFNMEAPTNQLWNIKPGRKGIFDWAMTYHRSSDVVSPYGEVARRDRRNSRSSNEMERDYWSEKDRDKFAVWMVSKCVTPSNREGFVRELKKFAKVDIYGMCGEKKCGTRMTLKNVQEGRSDRQCYKIMSSYMFYFAFENSLCEDYITEKFYKSLQMDVIPVVFGGGDYKAVAPPHSFIDALEFRAPENLALYLEKVASNQNLYNSYFMWKRYYTVNIGFPFSPFVCDLCSKLHQNETTISKGEHNRSRTKLGRYVNIADWFQKIGKCRTWNSDHKSTRIMHHLKQLPYDFHKNKGSI